MSDQIYIEPVRILLGLGLQIPTLAPSARSPEVDAQLPLLERDPSRYSGAAKAWLKSDLSCLRIACRTS